MSLKDLHIFLRLKEGGHLLLAVVFSLLFFAGNHVEVLLGELDSEYELCEELGENGDFEEHETSDDEAQESKIAHYLNVEKIALSGDSQIVLLGLNLLNYLNYQQDIPNPPPEV